MPQLFEATLESIKVLCEDVREFTFTLPSENKVPFIFIPGQFIRLFIPNQEGKPITRSFSLANNIWDPPNKCVLAASYVKGGVASEFLFNNAKLGDKLKCSGPFGKLVLKAEDSFKRIFLISTGTGVTPYRAMLPSIEKRPKEEKYILLQGVRNRSDLFYESDFNAFEKKHPNTFSFFPCLSRESEVQNKEYKGYVQDKLKDLEPNPESDLIYLCGNPNMIDETFEYLLSKGFEMHNIRREKYISPK